VEKRPIPYNGVVDALWHILTEERSDLPVERPVGGRRKEKGKEGEGEGHVSIRRRTGLGQLYRGLGVRLGAGLIVFLLGVLIGGGDEPAWAEL
jgi:fusion and transport protein UGO1